jgi:quinol monooxygenase YgiN
MKREQQESKRHCGILLVLKTTPGDRRELLLALAEFRQRVLVSPTCRSCDVFEDISETNRILWQEFWSEHQDASAVVESQRFRALLGASKLLGKIEALQWLDRSETGLPSEVLQEILH